MLGGLQLPRRPTLIQRPEKKKDVQNCWGRCAPSERQMKCRLGGWQFGGIVGRYPDLAGLAEIVKPAKTVMDQTPVPTNIITTAVPKEVPTAVFQAHKIISILSINTLGIRIFKCPVCESTIQTMEQLMHTSVKNTQK